MPLHILHIYEFYMKFMKTNPKEIQSECGVSLRGGGGGTGRGFCRWYHASETLNQGGARGFERHG